MDKNTEHIRWSAELLLNIISTEHENLRFHEDEHFSEEHENLSKKIGVALKLGKIVQLRQLVTRRDLELAFELHVDRLDHEIALIGIGPGDDGDGAHYDHIIATRGTRGSVVPPLRLLVPFLGRRAERRMKTHAVVMHNHPTHWLKELAEEHLGLPLGPSTPDRRVSHHWRNVAPISNEFVRIEMSLYESGGWRAISLPSAEQLFQFFERLLGAIDRKKPA
jgi:hypothetical protein